MLQWGHTHTTHFYWGHYTVISYWTISSERVLVFGTRMAGQCHNHYGPSSCAHTHTHNTSVSSGTQRYSICAVCRL